MTSTKPTVILDPFPRRISDIFTDKTFNELKENASLVIHDDGISSMPDALVDEHMSSAVLVLGQTNLPSERLAKARNLKGIINVETNFLPNIDYVFCIEHGIHVLTPGSAFAPVVAEISLGMAIDLCRGISKSDRQFRAGKEVYGLESNQDSFSLFGSEVGIIGYGDLGRQLHSLIKPFGCKIRVYDPWLPEYVISKRCGAEKVELDELLESSKVIFVFASVSSENEGFLNAEKLKLIKSGSVFLLMSRAAVVNWDDLLAEGHRLKIGTDVFPTEPLSPHDKAREQLQLLSAHRAGALVDALLDIGDQTASDAILMLKGLSPSVCRKAQIETVLKNKSKPVEKS